MRIVSSYFRPKFHHFGSKFNYGTWIGIHFTYGMFIAIFPLEKITDLKFNYFNCFIIDEVSIAKYRMFCRFTLWWFVNLQHVLWLNK